MSDMSKNTNLEIAVEIMAAKIAKMSREGYTAEDDKMKKLIDERNKMYIGEEDVIEKIITEYGPEIKKDYINIEGEYNMEENKTLEEVCTEYKLSEDERNEIGNKINAIMLAGKKTSEQPIAIIDIAPPGSGKTGLNGYACAQFKDNNAVVINSDELKPFHPRIDELAKKYPEYYTKVTNQESNFWTDNLFDVAVASRYNVIFEGTGRNLKLLTKMMSKMHGYKIVVRGMAVNELNCLMSIIERYEGQVEQKGWGRLVM